MNKRYIIYVWGVVGVTAALVLIGWRRKAANVAAQFIDEAEIGNNKGFASQVFEKMMRDVGWNGGEAWCMYFAKAVYMDAFPKKAAAINRILTGSTQQSFKNAMANPDIFKVITDGPPRKGDLIIWQSVNNASLGHAGIAYKRIQGDEWETIEGNTSESGAREGDGVFKKERILIPGTVEGSLRLLGMIRLRT